MKQNILALALALTVGTTQLLANTILVTQANFASLSPLQSHMSYIFNENIDASVIAPTSAFIGDGISQTTIDLNGFNLTLADGQTGIQINNSNPAAGLNTDISIKNGIIKANVLAVGTNSNGINATYFNGISIENVTFQNTRRGFTSADQLANNRNLSFSGCIFNLPSDISIRGIALGTIIGLKVTDCSFLPTSPDLNVFPVHILLINNASEIAIKSCNFDSCGTAIAVQSVNQPPAFSFQFPSTDLLIDQCHIRGQSATAITSETSNTILRNSTLLLDAYTDHEDAMIGFEFLPAKDGTTITGPIPTGCLIENCVLEIKNDMLSLPYTIGVALGELVQNGAVSDITIRNSSFIERDAPAEHFDLISGQSHGLLVENCIFDSNSTGRDSQGNPIIDPFTNQPIKSANICLGFGSEDGSSLVTSDVVIRNSICHGGSQVGILSDTAAGTLQNARITIDNCSITATEAGIELNNTRCSKIKNSRIKDVLGSQFADGIGVHISGPLSYNPTATSERNKVSSSSISNNTYGVVIDSGSTDNTIEHNSIFKNRKCQIIAEGNENKILNNIVFGKDDCCAPKTTPGVNKQAATVQSQKTDAMTKRGNLKRRAVLD